MSINKVQFLNQILREIGGSVYTSAKAECVEIFSGVAEWEAGAEDAYGVYTIILEKIADGFVGWSPQDGGAVEYASVCEALLDMQEMGMTRLLF